MMRIKLLTQLSLDGAKEIGAVLDVPDAQGESLCALGLAEVTTEECAPASEPAAEVAAEDAPEAATLEDAPERATHPRARKRGE